MNKIEYKTVSYSSLGKRLAGDDFGESFLRLLSEHGREGWDLKEVIRERGMAALVVFSRPSAEAACIPTSEMYNSNVG